ncbi:TPA: hypothetical protein DDZ01_00475 [Candidatus Uhrbacteria bacterium]|nr:MAG: hypothetical protein A2332_04945 [Candidatus Uhrbacteria bacterium RIFOXYB2_FULL_41_18]HBK34464.1 hypothetical protein [Candidatus Uhrbacteria bacterium]
MAKDVFSHLFMIIMLIIGVVTFISLLWQYINYQFPDILDFYRYTAITDILRIAISSLLVVWPVFLVLSYLIHRDLKKFPEKANLWVRKWLLHLTLFASGLAIVIDLINLINSFLSGELSMRFGLKVLVILLVATAVFAYYLWDLRRDVVKKSLLPLISAIISSVLILGWIIAGFFIVGTPAQQREARIDAQRIENLASIQYMIVDYWLTSESLPTSLDALKDPLLMIEVPVDPDTNESYTYLVTDDLSFKLCATFITSSDEAYAKSVTQDRLFYGNDPLQEDWTHGEGVTCFERTIDPERYTDVVRIK